MLGLISVYVKLYKITVIDLLNKYTRCFKIHELKCYSKKDFEKLNKNFLIKYKKWYKRNNEYE